MYYPTHRELITYIPWISEIGDRRPVVFLGKLMKVAKKAAAARSPPRIEPPASGASYPAPTICILVLVAYFERSTLCRRGWSTTVSRF
jgi:hypothetical protein